MAGVTYMCEFDCGYAGSFSDVEAHEAKCRQRVPQMQLQQQMEMHLMMMQQKQMGAHVSMSGTEEETRQKQHEEQSRSGMGPEATQHTAELRTLVEVNNDDQSNVDPLSPNVSKIDILSPVNRINSPETTARSPVLKLPVDETTCTNAASCSENARSFQSHKCWNPQDQEGIEDLVEHQLEGSREHTIRVADSATAAQSTIRRLKVDNPARKKNGSFANSPLVSPPMRQVVDEHKAEKPTRTVRPAVTQHMISPQGHQTPLCDKKNDDNTKFSPKSLSSRPQQPWSLRAPGPVAYNGIVIALGPECCAVSPSDLRFNPDFVDEALAELLSLEENCPVSVHQVSSSIQGDLLIVTIVDVAGPGNISAKNLSETLMMQALNPDSLLHRRGLGMPLRPMKEAQETTVSERDLAVVALCKLVRDQRCLVEKMGDEIKTLQSKCSSSTPQKIQVPLYKEEKDETGSSEHNIDIVLGTKVQISSPSDASERQGTAAPERGKWLRRSTGKDGSKHDDGPANTPQCLSSSMTLPEIEPVKEGDTSVRQSKLEELRRLTRIPCRSESEDKAYRILREDFLSLHLSGSCALR